jgi:hypothetical protein
MQHKPAGFVGGIVYVLFNNLSTADDARRFLAVVGSRLSVASKK